MTSAVADLRSEEIEMHPTNATRITDEEPQAGRPSWFERWGNGISSFIQRVNYRASKSPVGLLFRLGGCGHVSGAFEESFLSFWATSNVTDKTVLLQPKEIEDTCLSTEIRAGLTTFATMAYIIAVNV
jgi:AGZA family xanthine/uracil permease-like MFS transporter